MARERPLTERDIDVLGCLRAATDNVMDVYKGTSHSQAEGWVQAMDAGGTNGSHHSATLHKLSKRGLCDRWKLGNKREKGSCRYRINDAGRAFLERERIAGR
jgi:hypothetical protein